MNKKAFYTFLLPIFVCLFLFCMPHLVYASTMNTHLAGDEETRTNIEEPGSADTTDDLAKLNRSSGAYTT